MNTAATVLSTLVTVATLLLAVDATAQDGPRDPMQPPPALRAAAAADGSAAADSAPVVARHLMVIDGVRYVIDGGRRRGVGDLLGGARIERIDDSAIVVRNGRQLQRLPLFAGVVKRPVVEPVPGPVPVPTTTTTNTIATAVTGIRLADTPKRTAQAPTACADRPTCMQRPGEPR